MQRPVVWGSAVLVALVLWVAACADEEAPKPVAGPGQPCVENSDCVNDACIVGPDGTRACAGGDDDVGGW